MFIVTEETAKSNQKLGRHEAFCFTPPELGWIKHVFGSTPGNHKRSALFRGNIDSMGGTYILAAGAAHTLFWITRDGLVSFHAQHIHGAGFDTTAAADAGRLINRLNGHI